MGVILTEISIKRDVIDLIIIADNWFYKACKSFLFYTSSILLESRPDTINLLKKVNAIEEVNVNIEFICVWLYI